MEQIGRVLSGSTVDEIHFVVNKEKKVKIGNYYVIEHPEKFNGQNGCFVLLRVFDSYPYNPEMTIGSAGPLAGSRGINTVYGKHMEYFVARAEPLGYFDEETGKFRSLEVVPETWTPVYEPSKRLLKRVLCEWDVKSEGVYVPIGRGHGLPIPVYLDLASIAKGHLFVAGMTRSGKSSFVINLIKKSLEILNPPARFVVLDRRGEYGVLNSFGAKIFTYRSFIPKKEVLEPYIVVDRLGLNRNSSLGRLVRDAVVELHRRNVELTPENLLDAVESLALTRSRRNLENDLEYIRWAIDARGYFLKRRNEPQLDIIDLIYREPVIIIDFSVDSNLDDQYITVRELIKKITRHAIKRRREADFSVIIVVEEAQYLIPEKLAPILGDPSSTRVDKVFIESISQAGGYNVGFIVITQRPAYVSKSVVSQCNTVLCFRLKSGNDQDAMIRYSEYGGNYMKRYLSGLADHEALAWGLGVPFPFPVQVETDIEIYPEKSVATASVAWRKMAEAKEKMEKIQII